MLIHHHTKNTMRIVAFVFLVSLSASSHAQQNLKGIVLDSLTSQPLPFATVQARSQNKTTIASIDGKFSLIVTGNDALLFSYGGHRAKSVTPLQLVQNDTVLLAPLNATLDEVVIRLPTEKIARIVNTAIQNKALHNPDKYAAYECRVYYKMIVDVKRYGNYNMDSIRKRQDSLQALRSARRKRQDTAVARNQNFTFATPSHLFLTETYSKRLYKRPAQTQEIILAERISGLSKAYFANVITDVLPFHVYSDYIQLNGIDFVNPLAKGWQGRYRFVLEDELALDGDTLFLLRYAPKRGAKFSALSGLLYISSKGYAVTHFTGTNNAADSVQRFVKFEQIYKQIAGRWFPQELNYDFGIRRFPAPYAQLVWNGHAVIDSAQFDAAPSVKFDKAHPVKFSDSVDRRTATDWERFRKDTLSKQETNTYRNMDSIARKTGLEKVVLGGLRLGTGRLPVGKLDVDVRRLLAANPYEGTRLGLGLYTNNKISKYYSVGGWWGYGLKDKVAKYGADLTLYPKGDKETRIRFSFANDYRLTGEVSLHPELTQTTLRTWLLQQVDEVKTYALDANLKAGYWEFRPSFSRVEFGPLHYAFQAGGKTISSFITHEASLGFRYAYGEKRVPFLDFYLSSATPYPVVYASLSRGQLQADGLNDAYYLALAAVTFSKRINRWGRDAYRLEAGWIRSANNTALPRSLLLAGNGYRRDGLNFYAEGGFVTARPFDFYADRYVAFLYKHDLNKNFWTLKWSKPFLSFAHNFIYGDAETVNKLANPGLRSYNGGYHESGLLLNRLLRFNLGFAEAAVNTGAFYHWQKGSTWKENGVWVVGVSAGF